MPAKIILLYTLTLLALGTCMGQSGEWKSIDRSQYTIQYPVSWRLDESGKMGMDFLVASPIESQEDKFAENINLVIQDVSGMNIDLNKYVEISENQIKTMITNPVIIKSERIKGDKEFHQIIFSGEQGVYKLKFKQQYRVINNKAYVLTYTAEQKAYDKYLGIADKIIISFMLKSL